MSRFCNKLSGALLVLLFVFHFVSACQTARPTQAQDPLQAKLADSVLAWDDAASQQALQHLLQNHGAEQNLAELQSLAGQALAEAGQPTSLLVLARTDDADLQRSLRMLAPARCARNRESHLVLCSRARVDFSLASTRISAGQCLRVQGRLLGSSRLHSALLLRPDQQVETLNTKVDGRDFVVQSPAGLKAGLYRVELMVTTEQGREVAALWWLVVGGGRAPTPMLDQADPEDGVADQAARRYFAQMNQDRRAAGLAPLLWSALLSEAAQAHARTLARDNRLIHSKPAQLRALKDERGQKYAWLSENLARARSVLGARRAIMLSPAHFANEMQGAARVGGVGAAWQGQGARRTLFVVSLLGRPGSAQNAQAMAAEMWRKISAARRTGGLPKLRVDPNLAARARAHAATSCAAGRLLKTDVRGQSLSISLLQARPEFESAQALLVSRDDLTGWPVPVAALKQTDQFIGIGSQYCEQKHSWLFVVFLAQ